MMRAHRDPKTRKVTPPSPSYMTNDQFASYLAGLRANRTTRPCGARPEQTEISQTATVTARIGASRSSLDATTQYSRPPGHSRTFSQAPSIAEGSITSRYSSASARGRDYYPAQPAAPLKPSHVVPTATYMERGQRWMEKEEAFSLRDAMEELNLQDTPREVVQNDDARLYEAALDEASELVWQHQNGYVPLRPDGPYRYRPHLRKNSYAHARTASIGTYGNDIAATGLGRDIDHRAVSRTSMDSEACPDEMRQSIDSNNPAESTTSRRKTYGSINGSMYQRRKSSMKRNISGEIERPFSGDQIWEEPVTNSQLAKAATEAKPKQNSTRKSQNSMSHISTPGSVEAVSYPKSLERVEIFRNPPSRTRNAQYTTNRETPSLTVEDQSQKLNGVERRSQDIRDATSMRLKDRSNRLPTPSAVSDSPGRPIVSFDNNWKAPGGTTDANPDSTAPRTFVHVQQQPVDAMDLPSIIVAEENSPKRQSSPYANIPTICVGTDIDSPPSSTKPFEVPTISIDDGPARHIAPSTVTANENSGVTARPLPDIGHRRLISKSSRLSRGHFSLAQAANGRSKTICHECGFPIEGKFVALAGVSEKFHPHCFSCFTCHIALEAMEISPEPDTMRLARLDRIRRRELGEVLNEEAGTTMEDDGDDRLRFYCHLDWHEQFAPRCKHCKTPILGEHVVALGQHWHNGHFFCAECGDPFEHGMTHIEKDGYAWCINCQTKRTERRAPKCRMCLKAVIGPCIQALGSEWHEHCFRCAECRRGFDDGQIFPKECEVGIIVLCTSCRTRELKQ